MELSSLTPESLDLILASKLPSPDEASKDPDVRWRFVQHSLAQIANLQSFLARESNAMLSVKQEQQVSMLIQTSLALGVLPNLIPGVGLALEKRTKFVQCLLIKGEKQLEVEEVIFMVNKPKYGL